MKVLKRNLAIITILTVSLFNSCDNPSSSETVKEIGTTHLSFYKTKDIIKKEYPVKITNALDSDRLWQKTIKIDTTKYTFNWASYIKNINSEEQDHIAKTIFFLSSDHFCFNGGLMIPLANQPDTALSKKNSNIIEATINIFFLGDEQIKKDEIQNLFYLYHKNGELEPILLDIKNPNQYLLSHSEANFIISSDEILNDQINLNNIKEIYGGSQYTEDRFEKDYIIASIATIQTEEKSYYRFHSPFIKRGLRFSFNNSKLKYFTQSTFVFKR